MISMAEQETTYALSDLVKRRRADRRYSLRTLAERCIDPDTHIQEIKHSWIENLEKRKSVIPPRLPQLRALAAGLELPLRDIQDAAGMQFLGITTQQADGNIRILMNRAGHLSPEDLARLVAIADTFPVNPGKASGSSK